MKIPAGIEDEGLEVYFGELGNLKVLHEGKSIDYIDLRSNLREPFQAELIFDKSAQKVLIKEMKITDPDEMELKFVACRYGNLNNIPDLNDGRLISDAPSCKEIRNCPGFNILCKIPSGLSRQEYVTTVLVASGKLDKEIAYELDIEITTIRTYLGRIREKLGVNNRIEIALWAQKNNIV